MSNPWQGINSSTHADDGFRERNASPQISTNKLMEELQSLRNDVTMLKDRYGSEKEKWGQRNRQLEANVSDLTAQLSRAINDSQSVVNIRDEIDELQASNLRLQKELHYRSIDDNDKHSDVTQAKASMESLLAEFTHIQTELEQLRGRYARERTMWGAERNQLGGRLKEIDGGDETQDQLGMLKQRLAAQQEEEANLTNELEKAQEVVEHKNAQIKELNAEVIRLRESITKYEADAATMSSKQLEQKQMNEEDLNTKNQQILSMKRQKSNLNQLIDDAQDQIFSLEEKNHKKDEEIIKLKRELEEFKLNHEQGEERIKNMQGTSENHNQKIVFLKQEIGRLTTEGDALRKENTSLTKEIEALKRDNRRYKDSLADQGRRSRAVEDEMRKLRISK